MIDVAAGARALDEAIAPARQAGLGVNGLGLYRVIDAGDRAQAIASKLLERGVRVRAYPGGRLAVVPALDRAVDDAARFGEALRAVL
jgi:hypothetical protein